ncbi:inorganic diphosphatase [Salinisphaera sp. USBA-960]|nr:inorganic diphosphatase [Salifodinibacter halophilus]NNC26794.1 inorganic diphosphatase [Salifodinibacter halophilus]
MGYEALTPGKKAPEEVNVVVEILAGASSVKYEIDEDTDCLTVDRFMNVAMHYPGNYGFVPKTLYDDGDPVDALVLTPEPIVAGVVVPCRPVAVLHTEDESGLDAKILCVPTDKIATDYYKSIRDLSDLDERTCREIDHFFTHYKDLEDGKWSKVGGWEGADKAQNEIQRSMDAYDKS